MPKQITVTLEGSAFVCPVGTSIQQLIEKYLPERRADALAVRVGPAVKGLRWQPQQDCECALLTYADEEAGRMYERSVRFVFLLAVRELMPGARVRIEHSIGYGLYITIGFEGGLSGALVRKLERRMHEIVQADEPLIRTRWTREEAMDYFERDGQADKLRLLRYRPFDYFDVYTCRGMSEYFYGEMLPSTGYVRGFSLQFRLPGVILQLPAPRMPNRPALPQARPKLLRTFAETARWAGILHCDNAADLNDLIAQKKMRQFMRVNEALHERTIAGIADQILERRARVVLIAGPSSSGKTTFAHRLGIHLRVDGLDPVAISLDNYYRDRDKVPLDERGQPDLECLEALDVPLINEHLVRILQGEEVEIPRFSFQTGRRKEGGARMKLREDQPILIEGIHGLNDKLTAEIPSEFTFKVYISALTQLNLDDHNRIRTTDVRLLRRLVRDHQFRHSPADRTMSMWDSVRDGEEKYIFPFQEEADVMFNSSLLYELPVLKKYAYPMLKQVGEDSPWRLRSRRLLKFLNYFLDGTAEDEIPPTSILREFIGGCTFYME
ncbi:MAG: nucleoside kinase [Clostridia bacterium]|nr:nucleoside kinase [Clostridia bacterium]